MPVIVCVVELRGDGRPCDPEQVIGGRILRTGDRAYHLHGLLPLGRTGLRRIDDIRQTAIGECHLVGIVGLAHMGIGRDRRPIRRHAGRWLTAVSAWNRYGGRALLRPQRSRVILAIHLRSIVIQRDRLARLGRGPTHRTLPNPKEAASAHVADGIFVTAKTADGRSQAPAPGRSSD